MSDASERERELEDRCRRLERELARIRESGRVEDETAKVARDLARAQSLARVGSWQFDLNTQVVSASAETRRIYGVETEETTIPQAQAIPLPKFRPMMDEALRGLVQEGRPYDVEFQIRRPTDGAIRWIHSVAEYDPQRNLVLGTLHDITEEREAQAEVQRNQERLEAVVDVLQGQGLTLQEFLDLALEKALTVTESRFGFLFHYDQDSREFNLPSWSPGVIPACSADRSMDCLSLEGTGVLAELVHRKTPVILNDFRAEHQSEGGLPEGHPPLERFLALPVIRQDQVVAVVGVANKEDAYRETDILQLTLLLDTVWGGVENRRAQDALRESERKFRSFVENANDIVYSLDPEGRFSFVSPNWIDFLGHPVEEVQGRSFEAFVHPEDIHRCRDFLNKTISTKEKQSGVEYRVRHLDGSWRWQVSNGSPLRATDGTVIGISGIARDVTERKEAEGDREKLQRQLEQSQKMESVGRLAGGVAHDFNNMLNVILGHAEILLTELSGDAEARSNLEEIERAALRSADLTRQLLAFARKQTISPKILDLNRTIESLLKMLGRLLGEDIDLRWVPGEDLDPVLMDPGQVDQILVNLCVNARDAIGRDGGKITIETGSAELDEEYCADHPGFVPGSFVLLVVSDDGSGMDEKTKARIFEPFFTTKEMGKGTGLGLATVYGTVKQSDGFINVYSEPGKGSTFRIYLPVPPGSRQRGGTGRDGKAEPARGVETVLLVEDDGAMLTLTTRMMERLGYRVLSAQTPGDAIRLAREHEGEVQLLVTDVVMPELNGRELARQLHTLYPSMGTLFISGYTANVIAHHGVLDEGIHFLQKPFGMQSLAKKLREALEST